MLVELHPTINFVILHVCTNDIMRKQSTQMQNDMESLCTTIESLGKRCVISDPFPTLSNKTEHFSRLYNFHLWLKNFCNAVGYDFIPNFDYFWQNSSLYRLDGIHLNRKGTKLLQDNFINFIAFNL